MTKYPMENDENDRFLEKTWKKFNQALINWFDLSHRILPWREEPTPYHVWVSEIMLQQTRVEAVKPYYDRFLRALPDVEALAVASEQQLLKLWEGLGYYHRVRNMQLAAQTIVNDYHGHIPEEYDVLIELKGIGSYTAGAISSIAYGHPVPAIDGNVLRVMSRNLECDRDILKESTKRYFFHLLKEHMPGNRAGDFNQALMELGAMVCIPNGKPLCEKCPLYKICLARKNGTTDKYPVKAAKKQRKIVTKTIFLIYNKNGEILIRKRPSVGLLSDMWELPNIDEKISSEEMKNLFSRQTLGIKGETKQIRTGKHIFSHVEWHMTCITLSMTDISDEAEIKLKKQFSAQGEAIFASMDEIREKYPLPAAFSMWIL